MRTIFQIVGVALLLAPLQLTGQSTLLERRVTLTLENETMDLALRRLSVAGGFTFSYSPSVVDEGRTISMRFVDRSVREVLHALFGDEITYKVRGNYIILTPAENSTSRKEKDEVMVSGYVVDESTGRRLRDVSVYDPVTLASTVTDSFGYFEISFERPPGDVILSVNRESYADTIVVVPQRGGLLQVPLRVHADKLGAVADSVGVQLKRLWRRGKTAPQKVHRINVRDTLYRSFQASFVPYVGTNGQLSGHVVNDYSLNILAGHSLGVNRLEIGGVANTVRGHVSGAQFAGVFNGVTGTMQGAQVAGVVNINGMDTRGVHAAGVMNVNLADARATTVAGVLNLTAGAQRGPAIAGVLNVAGRDVATAQIAGVLNMAGDTVTGTQVAGVINATRRHVTGSQVAGVLNVARTVNGAQIGFLNVADSVAGVPLGFLSFVNRGYHKIEVSADEVFYNNIALRTGVSAFYNILFAGAKPATYKDDLTTWTFGYGLGSAPRLSRRLYLNLDLTAQQIVYGNNLEALDLLNKFHLGVDWQVLKKFSIAIGATVNAHLTGRNAETTPPLFNGIRPRVFYDGNVGSARRLQMWVGGKVAIRFL